MAIDKAVDLVRGNLFDLLLHLFALGTLNLGNTGGAVNLDAGTKDLDLVSVHGRVSNHDLGVLQASDGIHSKVLVKDKAFLCAIAFSEEKEKGKSSPLVGTVVEVRLVELTSGLLDELDVVQVRVALEAQDRLDAEVGKVVLVLRDNLGAEGRLGDGQELLLEEGWVILKVECRLFQGLERCRRRNAVAFDDCLRVHLLAHELFGLAKQLRGKDTNRGRAIANLLILHLGQLYK